MTHVMEQAFQNMSSEMGGKLTHYYHSLQHRFGDPRVYAAQEEQIRAQSAVVEHAQAMNHSDALRTAYQQQQLQIDETHGSRMESRRATRR